MLFQRTTHHVDRTPKSFPPEAERLWQTTAAGALGHQLEDDWRSLDRAMTDDRLQHHQDIGPDTAPEPMAELLEGAATLLRHGMAAAKDGHTFDVPFVLIARADTAPDAALHPVTRAVHDQLTSYAVSLENLRERVNRAHPAPNQISIADMLAALAELLKSGHARYLERDVVPSQRLIRDAARAHA